MTKYEMKVTVTVEIEMDDSFITDEFNKEFSEYMYPADCKEDHYENIIGQSFSFDMQDFYEGYGKSEDLKLKINDSNWEFGELEAVE